MSAGDLDQRRGRPDLAEDLAVDRARPGPMRAMSVTNIRVRTTSREREPGLGERRLDDLRASPAPGPPSRPGGATGRPGPASVVPATQHVSPTTTARL